MVHSFMGASRDVSLAIMINSGEGALAFEDLFRMLEWLSLCCEHKWKFCDFHYPAEVCMVHFLFLFSMSL